MVSYVRYGNELGKSDPSSWDFNLHHCLDKKQLHILGTSGVGNLHVDVPLLLNDRVARPLMISPVVRDHKDRPVDNLSNQCSKLGSFEAD